MDKKVLLKRVSKKSRVKLPPIKGQSDTDIKTIMDIDPDFYTLVDGRPIRPDTSIRKNKKYIKEVALKRTYHGFHLDEILRIDKDIKTERKIYETATKHFSECQESFDRFLADDNNKTIIVMKKSDNLDKELANQIEEHKKANYELASLRSKLQYIDETLKILIAFQNFLYKAAPVLWQDNNPLDLVTGNLDIITLDSDIFCKVNVNIVHEKLKELPPPLLYFENPEQILSIFQSLEQQNLNYLLKTVELQSEKNRFLKSASLLEDLLKKELDFIQEKMYSVQKSTEKDEDREKELKEEFFKILNDKIKYLVCSESVLKISNYVEFAYEQLIGPNETQLSTLDQVLALEQEYNSVMLELSAFELNDVKSIEKIIYEDGAREIKQAKEAAKILKDVDKLTKRLKICYNLKSNL